jgi:hypothetical protein
MDDIIEQGPFMGIEVECGFKKSYPMVAPGLGMAVEACHILYKKMIDYYLGLHFWGEGRMLNHETMVPRTTHILVEMGLQPHNDFQQVAGICIYPIDYFNPLESLTGRLNKTERTRSIHWYMASWQDSSPFRRWLSRIYHRLFGLRLHRMKEMLKAAKKLLRFFVIYSES